VLTVHTDGVDDVTDFVPVPVVDTVATKCPPAVALVGILVIFGALEAALYTEKLLGVPVAAAYLPLAATCGVRVHVPKVTKLTLRPLVTHTVFVLEVTERIPGPLVLTLMSSEPPLTAFVGAFVIVGVAGVTSVTVTDCGLPEAAR